GEDADVVVQDPPADVKRRDHIAAGPLAGPVLQAEIGDRHGRGGRFLRREGASLDDAPGDERVGEIREFVHARRMRLEVTVDPGETRGLRVTAPEQRERWCGEYARVAEDVDHGRGIRRIDLDRAEEGPRDRIGRRRIAVEAKLAATLEERARLRRRDIALLLAARFPLGGEVE